MLRRYEILTKTRFVYTGRVFISRGENYYLSNRNLYEVEQIRINGLSREKRTTKLERYNERDKVLSGINKPIGKS
jgi:hypothetical protein